MLLLYNNNNYNNDNNNSNSVLHAQILHVGNNYPLLKAGSKLHCTGQELVFRVWEGQDDE